MRTKVVCTSFLVLLGLACAHSYNRRCRIQAFKSKWESLLFSPLLL